MVVCLLGCGTDKPRRQLAFLADQYTPSSTPGAVGRQPHVASRGITTDGDVRSHVVTAPNGKQYRLRWRKVSESRGKPGAGSLEDGAKLPHRGLGFFHIGKHPFGTDETVTYVQYAAWAVAKLFPGTAPVVVGDISRNGGGWLSPHRSHRTGRDVDIGYYADGNRPLRWFKDLDAGKMDLAKTWTLLEALLRTGAVQYVFIDRSIQEQLYRHARGEGWGEDTLGTIFQYPAGRSRTIIRHVRGHRNHLHVRFRCPVDDDECNG